MWLAAEQKIIESKEFIRKHDGKFLVKNKNRKERIFFYSLLKKRNGYSIGVG